MKSPEFDRYLQGQSPKYSATKRQLMERLSQKGASAGGGRYTYLGPFYETFMYAFFIGFNLNKRTAVPDQKVEFLKLGQWKPEFLVKYILLLILTRHSNLFDLNAVEVDYTDDQVIAKAREIVQLMEEYANAGLIYLESRYSQNSSEFDDPFVFVNLLKQSMQVEGE